MASYPHTPFPAKPNGPSTSHRSTSHELHTPLSLHHRPAQSAPHQGGLPGRKSGGEGGHHEAAGGGMCPVLPGRADGTDVLPGQRGVRFRHMEVISETDLVTQSNHNFLWPFHLLCVRSRHLKYIRLFILTYLTPVCLHSVSRSWTDGCGRGSWTILMQSSWCRRAR